MRGREARRLWARPGGQRHGVLAAPGKRMTAGEAPHGQQSTPEDAETAHGLQGVLGTGGDEAAAGRLQGRDGEPIESYGPDDGATHEVRFPGRARAAKSFAIRSRRGHRSRLATRKVRIPGSRHFFGNDHDIQGGYGLVGGKPQAFAQDALDPIANHGVTDFLADSHAQSPRSVSIRTRQDKQKEIFSMIAAARLEAGREFLLCPEPVPGEKPRQPDVGVPWLDGVAARPVRSWFWNGPEIHAYAFCESCSAGMSSCSCSISEIVMNFF